MIQHPLQRGNRWFASNAKGEAMCHPNGKAIRFRSLAHAQRHADTMQGKQLTPNKARRKGKKKARRR